MPDHDSTPDTIDVAIERPRQQDIPRARIVLALASAAFTVVVLVVLYFVLPLNRKVTTWVGLDLGVGLVLVTGLLIWQGRAITSSRYPRFRAVQTLAVSLPLFLLLFAVTYYLLQRNNSSSFNASLTRTDALYFTVTTFSTVGFGDIVARSETARIIVTVQMLGDLLFLGFGVRVILQAVQFRLHSGSDAVPTEVATPPPIGSPARPPEDRPGEVRSHG